MPQISLYVNRDLLNRVQAAAKKDGMSVSHWVARRLSRELDGGWPEGYERLFGSLADDETFVRPPPGDPSLDVRRETL